MPDSFSVGVVYSWVVMTQRHVSRGQGGSGGMYICVECGVCFVYGISGVCVVYGISGCMCCIWNKWVYVLYME